MSDFQQEKNIILEFYQALDAASPGEVEGVLKGAVAADYIWRGFHPLTFNARLNLWPRHSGVR